MKRRQRLIEVHVELEMSTGHRSRDVQGALGCVRKRSELEKISPSSCQPLFQHLWLRDNKSKTKMATVVENTKLM